MKKIYIKNLALLGAIIIMASCSENAWNDRLDGFEVAPVYEESVDVTYTLTSSDYTTIAQNSVNISLATTPEEQAALAAIGTNKCFENIAQARKYIPAFLYSTTFPYFTADDGSTILISFALPNDESSIVSTINKNTTEYVISSSEYQEAWNNDTDYVNAFAPMLPAEKSIPGILAKAFPNAEQGQYVVVNYEQATTNPIFGEGGNSPEEEGITSNIRNLSVGDKLTATAVVTGICSRGMILSDNAGSILYYQASNFNQTTYPIGTIVKVSGDVSAYNKGLQLTDNATIEVVGNEDYSYPTPTAYTSSMIEEAVGQTDNMLAKYVTIQGQLSISGNYYNIIIDGASAQGSIYYASDDVKSKMENGKSYNFYGYYVAISGTSTKFFNILVTDVIPLITSDDITSNIQNLSVGDNLTATAVVTGICSRGMILTDNAGSILYYQASNFNQTAYPIGTIVNVSGEVSAYNKGLQLTDKATIEAVGVENYVYPVAKVYTATMVDEAITETNNMLASYVSIEGTLNISGTYYNIILEGASAQGSIYYVSDDVKSKLENGKSYKFYGYYIAISGSTTKFFNLLVTDVVATSSAAAVSSLKTRSSINTLETVNTNAIYMFDGTKWVVPAKTVVLQPSDYVAMNQSYGNLSNDLPSTLLPIYLKENYPYSVEDDIMVVVYKYYNGSSTSYQCSQFKNDGTNWNSWIEQNMAEDRFSKTNGKWTWNPSVTINLPYIRNDVVSGPFYQACVDWVWENIDVPYYGSESLKDGKGFVTTYGNNEYYTGASAYYGNVDIRPGSARSQCAAGFGDFPGYGDMTDEEVISSMKYHFDYEVIPAVLGILYPSAMFIEDMDVTYTINFTAYQTDGAFEYTGVWKVIDTGKFEFVSNTWYGESEE